MLISNLVKMSTTLALVCSITVSGLLSGCATSPKVHVV